MFFKVGGFTTALIVWSLLMMLWMSSFHPIAVVAVLFSTVCLFFQEKVVLKARGLGVLAVVALLRARGAPAGCSLREDRGEEAHVTPPQNRARRTARGASVC